MSDNGESPPESEDLPGVLGDGELKAGKYNMALVRRAIANDWPISADVRQRVVKQMSRILDDSEDQRYQIAAARVLVMADGVNVRREANAIESQKEPGNIHIHNTTNVVKLDRGWYGNDAWNRVRDVAAGTTAPPVADTPVPDQVQGDSVRPEVGQNGHGSANGHAGPRPGTGSA